MKDNGKVIFSSLSGKSDEEVAENSPVKDYDKIREGMMACLIVLNGFSGEEQISVMNSLLGMMTLQVPFGPERDKLFAALRNGCDKLLLSETQPSGKVS